MHFFSGSRKFVRSAALLLALLIFTPVMQANACPLYTTSGRIAALDIDFLATEAEEPVDAIALSLEELADAAALSAEEDDAHLPHVWPVRFSESGLITSYFGNRTDPVTGESTEFHAGLDLADKLNSKIYAAGSGIVTEVESSAGYGLYLMIDHGNGYTTRYSHCSSILVEVGDEVTQGQIIATMGASGRVTGVHLDFRIYLDGEAVDPMLVLDEAAD